MDFTVGLDGLCYFGGSDAGVSEQKSYGSVGCLTKQGRPGGFLDDDPKNLQAGSISSSKMLKRDDPLGSKPMLFQTRPTILRSNSLFPDGHLGFSSATKPDGLLNSHNPLQTASVPSFQSTYSKTSGLHSTSLNGDMHGVLAGVRGPFTPSQWLELEHQALIFKYISAGVPVPPNLLLPIRKALNLTPLSAFPAGSLRPNGFGWGSFHLGFSGNPDPEPGRCRRTDGKKWRCSRDAVADQKYCERHMNRGRHRSKACGRPNWPDHCRHRCCLRLQGGARRCSLVRGVGCQQCVRLSSHHSAPDQDLPAICGSLLYVQLQQVKNCFEAYSHGLYSFMLLVACLLLLKNPALFVQRSSLKMTP